MYSWQVVRLVAGVFIMGSLAMGIPGSILFVSEWWLAFTAFVGLNLAQSAVTRWCLMETIMRKLGFAAGAKKGRAACNWYAPAAAPLASGKYNIRRIPSMLPFEDGQEQARIAGAMASKNLRGWVKAHTRH